MATNYFRIEAPYPTSATTVLLPSPQVGNNMGLLSDVQVIRMRDGSTRSYIKRGKGDKKYRYDFTVTRDKMEEVADFINRYRGSRFRVVWRERTVIGKLSLNPIEFSGDARETYNITLEVTEV